VCASEVKRVMMERAKSVDLDPEIEDACLVELGGVCSEKTGKNEVNIQLTLSKFKLL